MSSTASRDTQRTICDLVETRFQWWLCLNMQLADEGVIADFAQLYDGIMQADAPQATLERCPCHNAAERLLVWMQLAFDDMLDLRYKSINPNSLLSAYWNMLETHRRPYHKTSDRSSI